MTNDELRELYETVRSEHVVDPGGKWMQAAGTLLNAVPRLLADIAELEAEVEKYKEKLDIELLDRQRTQEKLTALRDAECPTCGRSLPPDGDCYGCEVDRQAAVIAEVGRLAKIITQYEGCAAKDILQGELDECLLTASDIDFILEKARDDDK